MSNHTPGPWEFDGSCVITDEFCIAVIEDDGGYEAPSEQRAPNGRLIAASPELFEALKGLLTACTDSGSVTEALRAAQDALVKAAGKDW